MNKNLLKICQFNFKKILYKLDFFLLLKTINKNLIFY
jgi:hypothetical protein